MCFSVEDLVSVTNTFITVVPIDSRKLKAEATKRSASSDARTQGRSECKGHQLLRHPFVVKQIQQLNLLVNQRADIKTSSFTKRPSGNQATQETKLCLSDHISSALSKCEGDPYYEFLGRAAFTASGDEFGQDECAPGEIGATQHPCLPNNEMSPKEALAQLEMAARDVCEPESPTKQSCAPVNAPMQSRTLGASSGSTAHLEYTHSSDIRHYREHQLDSGQHADCKPITTAMLRNVPCQYTDQQLIAELARLGFSDSYDFFYMPKLNRRSDRNVGYAFINLKSPMLFDVFRKKLNNYRFKQRQASFRKRATVSCAWLQGLEQNREYFRRDSP